MEVLSCYHLFDLAKLQSTQNRWSKAGEATLARLLWVFPSQNYKMLNNSKKIYKPLRNTIIQLIPVFTATRITHFVELNSIIKNL